MWVNSVIIPALVSLYFHALSGHSEVGKGMHHEYNFHCWDCRCFDIMDDEDAIATDVTVAWSVCLFVCHTLAPCSIRWTKWNAIKQWLLFVVNKVADFSTKGAIKNTQSERTLQKLQRPNRHMICSNASECHLILTVDA